MGIELQFAKGQGTGNDFVIVADPEGELELSTAQVARLCDRHFGVGADGLLRVVRSRAIPEGRAILAEDPDAEWFMDYRNADGSIAEMCGNGVRVFLHYLLERSMVELPAGSTLALGTRAGIVDLARSSTGYQVDMGRWRLVEERLVRSRGLEVPRPGLGIQLGNPHVVVALASEQELAELRLDEAPVLDPPPVDGANVEFVVPSEPLVRDGVGQIRMRVHERGVGETLSCGTGAVAAALAARHWAGAGAPNHWRVQLPGGVLGVRMIPTQEGEHVALSGPAELIFSGSVWLADD